MIAVGTEAARDPRMPLDGNCVFSSDDILQLKDLPGSLAVIGAGVIGCEYASIFAALGVQRDDHREDTRGCCPSSTPKSSRR